MVVQWYAFNPKLVFSFLFIFLLLVSFENSPLPTVRSRYKTTTFQSPPKTCPPWLSDLLLKPLHTSWCKLRPALPTILPPLYARSLTPIIHTHHTSYLCHPVKQLPHSLSRVVVPATLHSISVNAHFTRFL